MSEEKNKSTRSQKIILVVSLLCIVTGLYILLLLIAPKVYQQYNIRQLEHQPVESGNRVVIPSVGINVPIQEGGVEVLETGAWHQYPELGNPETGGNFIIAAHSFLWGTTPIDTIRQSYFYSLPQTKLGDKITVRWGDKLYDYQVENVSQITPNDTSILASSEKPVLTLYTCTPGGSADGRVVVQARPI